MSLRTYTVPFEDEMRVRHDARARFTVTAGRKVLQDDLIDPASIGGAMTLASFTYNRASYSGGVDWWDPATGKPVSRPKIKVRFRPEDVLTGDQLCTCPTCS